MKCGGIVLCGGHSNRMGVSKANLPFGSETMLQRVVRLLSQVVEPIVVVAALGQELPELPPEVLLARDRAPDRGPLEGLRAGLTVISPHVDAAYATSCDVPLLMGQFVRQMIDKLDEHQIAVPVEGKFAHPLAAVYRTSTLPTIEQLLEENRLRPFFLFEQVDTYREKTESLRRADPSLHTLANLNRPQDYLDAVREAGFTAPPEVVARLQEKDSWEG